MSLTSLLDKIAGRQQQRRKGYEADFHQLVVQIANGNEPDPEAIEDVLAASQKTLDDLREAVELLNHRKELRSAVDGVQKLEEERKRLEGAIAEADRIFNDASARHDATVDPLDVRLKQIKTLTSEADRARQELYSTCPNADLVSPAGRGHPAVGPSEASVGLGGNAGSQPTQPGQGRAGRRRTLRSRTQCRGPREGSRELRRSGPRA